MAFSPSWPMEAHTSVKMTSAPSAASIGLSVMRNMPGYCSVKASTCASGRYASGQAMDTWAPSFRKPTMRLFAMLLPSPM